MLNSRGVAAVCFGFVALLSAPPLAAQAAAHLIVVKMIDMPNARFAFQPAVISALRGDTVRFLQASSAPHDVAFRKRPKGAKLGPAATGPYVIARGQSYDLLIDQRFPVGAYNFVCDPHEGVGMAGVLNVGTPSRK